MAAAGVSVIVRGRAAWIAAIVFGALLALVGIAIGATKGFAWGGSAAGWLIGSGSAFAVLGALFLILSYATHGQSD